MITLENIDFGYSRGVPLFTKLSLGVSDGGIYGLLGKNGAGKTSLLKIISGLVFAQTGVCRVFDQNPKDRSPNFLSELYLLPEDLYVPPMSAEDYCKCYAPFYPKFDSKIFTGIIKEFEISNNRLLTELSHGQKKKFLIAFGIATQARLFILDEPTNGLDIPSKTLFRQLLVTYFNENRTFIISTHQVHDIQNLIDHVILLDGGKIIFNHQTVEISKCFTFSRQVKEPQLDECLYYEKQLGGYSVIHENRGGEETEIDLEMLFNAVLSKNAVFENILNKQ